VTYRWPLLVASVAVVGAVTALMGTGDTQVHNVIDRSGASTVTRPAPTGAAGLFANIRNDDHHGDGFRIERVLGPDGQTRLIVYFKGQDTTPGRDLGRSIGVSTGLIGADTDALRAIDGALADCPQARASEVMLVGLSQGGMDAQNIAALHRYRVAALVTFGSPIVRFDDPGIATVHIRATGDPVPIAGQAARAMVTAILGGLALPMAGALRSVATAVRIALQPTVFTYDPHDGVGMHVHENDYPAAARDFDRSDAPGFAAAKEHFAKFHGTETVIVD